METNALLTVQNLRIDLLLVQQQLARSRTEAQKLVARGQVRVRVSGVLVPAKKASEKFPEDSECEVDFDVEQFVSRAGVKLQHALNCAQVDLNDGLALDIGQSTGGFTDCLLRAGVQHVVGIDVGREQLVPELRNNARVTCVEGYNARILSLETLPPIARGGFDIAVMDVSFISQTLILPRIPEVLKPGGWLVSLVKPQFEVGREGIGKKGIVRDERLYPKVQRTLTDMCQTLNLAVSGYFESPVRGGDGNREFLLVGRMR